MKKPKGKTPSQAMCDRTLTPIIKAMYPRCLLCNNPTQVAHHHVHKSKSNALRYYIPNLINLCNSCHCALHQNESYHASRIIKIKGLKWFDDIERIKNQVTVKTDWIYYQQQYERLNKILKDENKRNSQ